jgi:rubrerythrin
MAQFINPFVMVTPSRKFTTSELIQAIRQDISAEHEAIHLYLSHADATTNKLAQKVLREIANEEKIHVGEFQRLLEILAKDEKQFMLKGEKEVKRITSKPMRAKMRTRVPGVSRLTSVVRKAEKISGTDKLRF